MASLSELWQNNTLMAAAGVAEQELPEGALYVVGLPIGNMGDITLRALWVLSHADTVVAEDTRETRKLLDKFGVNVRLFSVREHNEVRGAEQIIDLLRQGKRVAMVTDAGTPAVSDPGARAVHVVREAGFRVIPIPGASAVVTALSAAGLSGTGFSFVGFPAPQPKARRADIAHWAARVEPFVFYEAPHRILAMLGDLAAALDPSRRVVVARELTKRFETIVSLTAAELAEWVKTHEPRGEYVVIVDEAPTKTEALTERDLRWLQALKDALPASKLAAAAAKATGGDRSTLYAQLTKKDED